MLSVALPRCEPVGSGVSLLFPCYADLIPCSGELFPCFLARELDRQVHDK
jgi:hypothetical protein